ncbi:hypothetical protein J1N35_012433, partial [Gossypium stocksii]
WFHPFDQWLNMITNEQMRTPRHEAVISINHNISAMWTSYTASQVEIERIRLRNSLFQDDKYEDMCKDNDSNNKSSMDSA